jgi:hypothetical protein
MCTTPSTFSDTLFCTLDTSRVAEEEGPKVSAGKIRSRVEDKIRNKDGHEDWRCRAVTMSPKRPHRVKIICRDETELQLVKKAAEVTAVSGTRILRDELFPIKVDSVNRLAVLDENGMIRNGAAETFSQENETTVAKIAWLSKKVCQKLMTQWQSI